MSAIQFLDRVAFVTTVLSASVSAAAGGYGWTKTAVVSGCIAAMAPIVSRIANNRELTPLRPRALTPKQSLKIAEKLREGPPFRVWVAHNRHEAEPAAYHAQVCEALKAGGLDITWFGGMTNTTMGVELSGPETSDKRRLMSALDAAGVNYQPVVFTDDPQSERHGVALWIGVRA
ncbi:hypothetical protein [Rhodanobacter denitrificans]|uniref:hypothetical protein n=1 Tax=Rhodanobacter denitrificans TaxID=666685 RepID=UPI0012FDFE48|nr:hypothetical protein [Rhodanobacter denitrificans]UJM87388.1 hypothetical protein LRJ86_03510 [Rhodanobacter denitrificans]